MKFSILFATLIALTAAGWILSGQFGGRFNSNNRDVTAAITQPITNAKQPISQNPTTVRVRESIAQPMVNEIVVLGRTEASRKARIRAETRGRIVSVDSPEGAALNRDQTIATISIDDRAEILLEAETQLTQRELEFKAASKLQKKGYQSRNRLAEAVTRLNAAKAYLAKIEIDIQRTTIKSPFDGILQHRDVEVGDYVKVGDPIATVIDLNPILVIGYLSERNIEKIKVGSSGYARIITGQNATGKIRYISSAAGQETRTFEVELEVANKKNRILQGLTTELRLPVGKKDAHLLSPAMLTLADNGVVGVKIVNSTDRVEFVPVTILGDTQQGMWIGGLPPTVTLITVGQEFVQTGARVIPIKQAMDETT